ncbi:enolase C-terminal domain-like protein [Paracoccus onubensis]|uniref:mandelate racemase/muconate lactonizing enzyme family protein n=1 Tax=Paracoccus onubensis TaxID=1675788 RepID=UPI00272F5681|nr:enolase C-terminal domain-like protein [Paracoccus onubensis]MDP0926187.1 enolase C-terminal domain-like protein [Paracoccus onubensis]
MPRLKKAVLRRLKLPLIRPYRLSYRTFEEFEPFLLELEDEDGNCGFADGHVSPGSSDETRDGAWAFLDRHLRVACGREPAEVLEQVLEEFGQSKVAATTLATALEHLGRHPLLDVTEVATLPLLTPINQTDLSRIPAEIEGWLAQGFRTFKVKVGKDVVSDLARVAAIQTTVAGRATLRLDANRGFSRDEGIRFAAALDPTGIELFEQPCPAEDWEANGAVAAASTVPLMLDEPICALEDIERAGTIPGVGFCKLKLKRFGGLQRLREGLEAVRAHGMEPVLGDGLGSEIHNWMEACIARGVVRNAGEFNGFLKPRDRLFAEPMQFRDGAVHLPANFHPTLDSTQVERLTAERRDYVNRGG